MKKIIEREITNEDGDFYGVCGNITRLGAYRAIKQDLREYGIENEVEFTPDSLEEFDFWETVKCPSGEHDGYIWWGKPATEDEVKFLGKGWGLNP
jgi:hypothetical protein